MVQLFSHIIIYLHKLYLRCDLSVIKCANLEKYEKKTILHLILQYRASKKIINKTVLLFSVIDSFFHKPDYTFNNTYNLINVSTYTSINQLKTGHSYFMRITNFSKYFYFYLDLFPFLSINYKFKYFIIFLNDYSK